MHSVTIELVYVPIGLILVDYMNFHSILCFIEV